MPTLSEERVMIAPSLPKQIADILDQESKTSGMAQTTLIRHMIKWHAGKAAARYEKAPAVKLPKRPSLKVVKKSFLVDVEDAKHLDALVARTGMPRVGVLMLIIFAWFGLEAIPKKD